MGSYEIYVDGYATNCYVKAHTLPSADEIEGSNFDNYITAENYYINDHEFSEAVYMDTYTVNVYNICII